MSGVWGKPSADSDSSIEPGQLFGRDSPNLRVSSSSGGSKRKSSATIASSVFHDSWEQPGAAGAGAGAGAGGGAEGNLHESIEITMSDSAGASGGQREFRIAHESSSSQMGYESSSTMESGLMSSGVLSSSNYEPGGSRFKEGSDVSDFSSSQFTTSSQFDSSFSSTSDLDYRSRRSSLEKASARRDSLEKSAIAAAARKESQERMGDFESAMATASLDGENRRDSLEKAESTPEILLGTRRRIPLDSVAEDVGLAHTTDSAVPPPSPKGFHKRSSTASAASAGSTLTPNSASSEGSGAAGGASTFRYDGIPTYASNRKAQQRRRSFTLKPLSQANLNDNSGRRGGSNPTFVPLVVPPPPTGSGGSSTPGGRSRPSPSRRNVVQADGASPASLPHRKTHRLRSSLGKVRRQSPTSGTSIFPRRTSPGSTGTRRASPSTMVNPSVQPSIIGPAGAVMPTDTETAMSNLENANSEWESVAAAAAIVQNTGTKHHRRYGVGDRVLVYLSILNNTMAQNYHDRHVDEHDENQDLVFDTTINPVNKFGYPADVSKSILVSTGPRDSSGGSGRGFVGDGTQHPTPEELKGPYVYVLATVKKVHFEEDAQYYTVTRADNGTDQRADTEWMEPIKSEKGLEAALKAARQTTRSSTATKSKGATSRRVIHGLSPLALQRSFQKSIGKPTVSLYRKAVDATKRQATLFLYGNKPYMCRVRLTAINLLVICSIFFLFVDQAVLAFAPANQDWAWHVAAVVIWIILVLELAFEALIRPEGYSALIASEKAYAPSTARFINRFHLTCEIIALGFYTQGFRCVGDSNNCGENLTFSLIRGSLKAVVGRNRMDAFIGHLTYSVVRLRIFGLVRHWKQMWINHTFVETKQKKGIIRGFLMPRSGTTESSVRRPPRSISMKKKKKDKVDEDDLSASQHAAEVSKEAAPTTSEEDRRLNKAATIGTALMVVNSHRAMVLLVAIVGILPLIYSLAKNGGANTKSYEMVNLLQGNNLAFPNSSECDFLEDTVNSWLRGTYITPNQNKNSETDVYILWGQILPIRCPFQEENDGVFTKCDDIDHEICLFWNLTTADTTAEDFADELNLRLGVITTVSKSQEGTYYDANNELQTGLFNVTVMYNQDNSVRLFNMSSLILQVSLLALILMGLTVLRGDAGRLVLDPLQRMLKIVLRYAANPLSPTPRRKRGEPEYDGSDDSDNDDDKDQLGNFETEQLINTIAKITDLLRKCWGVAGAGIISSNLARTQEGKTVMFNPTVPGKLVYALFGFASINEFSQQLRALDKDIMILINDVAKVVHDEVFRWGLGDSGQCNKNLGSAFLMVFRIGDFKEVHEKKEKAQDVIFKSADKRGKKVTQVKRRYQSGGKSGGKSRISAKRGTVTVTRTRHNNSANRSGIGMDTIQLASLPGISAFTDRAVIGFLKSFAGIYRDRNLQNWKKDFRLGAGVGAFSVDLIFGMDAGWAVEGAVGSEYKIDATYLSPHVNMASRMMSASKQYGVSILLSQAVEELMSDPARRKLRHLDTVFVKGSRVAQRIFTYDARHKGVDFFLIEKTVQQADLDSERYTPHIWNTDPDLKAMRQHVTEEFAEHFNAGRRAYLNGDWKPAIKRLKEADRIMLTTVVEEGFFEYDLDGAEDRLFEEYDENEDVRRIRNELGDGACKCLISYMENRDGVAPPDWGGVRPLTSK